MLKQLLFSIVLILSLTSCSSNEPERLKISATTWIGYTPLFYAKEKGWLKPLNIKLLNVSSLSENMYLYEAGNSDAYVGTQYEYSLLVKKDPTLMPIMMFDRSYGGDIVMSNTTIEALQNSNDMIDAYLELDSINITILKDFIRQHGLKQERINYINMDQAHISILQAKAMKRDTLIVTYIPYDTDLKEDGFMEVASTKESLDLLVVDALFTTEKTFQNHREQFLALNTLVQKALFALEHDPKEFYEAIKPYILELSYEDFRASLSDIIWIHKEISPELKKRMQEGSFPTRDLM
jgi:NitT/TauT family transport system substrate-binding protein